MKKIICLCFAFAALFLFSACQHHLTCGEMGDLFEQNKNLFEKAAQEITQVPCEHLWIEKSDPNNDRLYVVQIRDLYFSSTEDELTEELCTKLYDSVEPLFSRAGAKEGIAYSTSQIQFSMKLEYGCESSIIYAFSGQKPHASFEIAEAKEISENWYAVIARD